MNLVEWAPLLAVILTVVGSACMVCYKMGRIEASIKALVKSVEGLYEAYKTCDGRLDKHDRRLDRHDMQFEQISGEK